MTPPDAVNPVSLRVSNVIDARADVQFRAGLDEVVRQLGPGISRVGTVSQGKAWYTVWPIGDVQEFADRLRFAKVTKVEGRTIDLAGSAPERSVDDQRDASYGSGWDQISPPDAGSQAPSPPVSTAPGALRVVLSNGRVTAGGGMGISTMGLTFQVDYKVEGGRVFPGRDRYFWVIRSRHGLASDPMPLRLNGEGTLSGSATRMSRDDGPFESYIEERPFGMRGTSQEGNSIALGWVEAPKPAATAPSSVGRVFLESLDRRSVADVGGEVESRRSGEPRQDTTALESTSRAP